VAVVSQRRKQGRAARRPDGRQRRLQGERRAAQQLHQSLVLRRDSGGGDGFGRRRLALAARRASRLHP